LDDPNFSNCGVCIKGGTPFTFDNPKQHIGGLLLLPEDKEKAKALVRGSGAQPTYTPTFGDCPSGYFFASRAECEKQVNRLDCDEAGQTGGFENGTTSEGSYSSFNPITRKYRDKNNGKIQVAREKCAKVFSIFF
jgi:hypothetical protein